MAIHHHKDRFFHDTDGNLAVIQFPNIPLTGWILSLVLSLVPFPHTIKSGFMVLSTTFLFTWAFLELTPRTSYFRQALGAVIMILVLVGIFR